MPLPMRPEGNKVGPPPPLRPVELHKSLAKVFRGIHIYTCLLCDKFSTKWKRQPRVVIVTSVLLLVCGRKGKVHRILELDDISELYIQYDTTGPLILVKLASLGATREPDFLCCVVNDNRNTHSAEQAMSILYHLVCARPAHRPPRFENFAANGPVRGIARLGHNPVPPKLKMRQLSQRRRALDQAGGTPNSTPNTAPTPDLESHGDDVTAPAPVGAADPAPPEDLPERALEGLGRKTSFSQPGEASQLCLAVMEPEAPLKALPAADTTETTQRALDDDDDEEEEEEEEDERPSECAWTEHKDPTSGLLYYYNKELGKSTWHEPPELKEWKERMKGTSAGMKFSNFVAATLKSGEAPPSPIHKAESPPLKPRVKFSDTLHDETLLDSSESDRTMSSSGEGSYLESMNHGTTLRAPASRGSSRKVSSGDTTLQDIANLLEGPPVVVHGEPPAPRLRSVQAPEFTMIPSSKLGVARPQRHPPSVHSHGSSMLLRDLTSLGSDLDV